MADAPDTPKIPEMVERVARALIAVAEHGLDTDADRIVKDAYGNPWHPAWQDYIEDATKAIEAMREPTEAMKEVGEFSPLHPEGAHGEWDCMPSWDIWRAMIDAALGE